MQAESDVNSDVSTHFVRVGNLAFCGFSLWLLGYPDRALRRAREACNLALAIGHPYSLAGALTWEATVHQFRRDPAAVRELTERVSTLSQEQGFQDFLPTGRVLLGWLAVRQGRAEEGLAQMRQGLDALEAARKRLMTSYLCTLLTEAYTCTGRHADGLAGLENTLRQLEETGERMWVAELHRLRGELLLRQTTADERHAESCFRQALDISRRQSAKSLELRAAMSLARLWRGQGKKEEARRILEQTYRWFTEGFATADLQQAAALLERLGR